MVELCGETRVSFGRDSERDSRTGNIEFGARRLIGDPREVGRAATTIASSTFDTDLEGWTSNNGEISYAATSGNPGGYVRFADATQGM